MLEGLERGSGGGGEQRGEVFVAALQVVEEGLGASGVRGAPGEDLLHHARGVRAAVDVAHDERHAGGDAGARFRDLRVPLRLGVLDDVLDAEREAGGACLAEGGEDGGGEAAVDACSVDGGGDVKAGADLALGGAVGGLGEVVQDLAAVGGGEGEGGGGEVVG